MKRFRVLMMTTTLLASATMAHAQGPQNYPPSAPAVPPELAQLQEAEPQTPDANAPSWYVQAAGQSVAAWQRLRVLCGSGQMPGCCEGQASQAACKDAAGCPGRAPACAKTIQFHVQVRTMGSIPPGLFLGNAEIALIHAALAEHLAKLASCGGIKDSANGEAGPIALNEGNFDIVRGFTQLPCPVGGVKVAGPCACAKACGCCETCKTKPAQTAQYQPMPPPMPGAPWSPPYPQWAGPVPGWVFPGTPALPAPRLVIGLPMSNQPTKPAHLVTPDLEAHCQRIIHKDGAIILEGNVLLLRKKHAQPIRIEAPRVILNLRDGSFVVESEGPKPLTTSSFGASQRIAVPMVGPFGCPMSMSPNGSYPVPPTSHALPVSGGIQGIIQVVPATAAPR